MKKKSLTIPKPVFCASFWRKRDLGKRILEIRQNYFYFANLESDIEVTSNEGMLQWFDFDEVPELDMPFTAKYVVRHYLKTGRKTDLLYGFIIKDTHAPNTILIFFNFKRRRSLITSRHSTAGADVTLLLILRAEYCIFRADSIYCNHQQERRWLYGWLYYKH